MRRVKIVEKEINLTDEVEVVLEKTVTAFGTGAQVICPKDHIGKRAYLVIIKD